jgi:hypothetical protein
VNDPDPQNPLLPAKSQVVRQKVFNIPGIKGMQIKHSVYRYFNRTGLFHFLVLLFTSLPPN